MKNTYITLLLFLIAPLAYSQDGPGGVGSADGSSTLDLWLSISEGLYSDAGSTEATNGDAIEEWHDLSGHNNDLKQDTLGKRPTLITNVSSIGNKNTVRFDATNDENLIIDPASYTNNNQEDWFIALVFKDRGTSDAFGSIFSTRDAPTATLLESIQVSGNGVSPPTEYSISGGPSNIYKIDDASNLKNSYVILSINRVSATTSFEFWRNDTALTGRSYSNNAARRFETYRLGINRRGNRFFDGDFSEFVMFQETPNATERSLIHNYLSGKYDIPIDNDCYNEQSGYKNNIAGIGKSGSAAKHISAESGGLLIEEDNTTISADEWVYVGHDNGEGTSTSNLPVGTDTRWERSWYLEKCNSTAVDVSITFDFDKAGFSSTTASGSASNYELLYRANTSSSFTVVTVSTTSFHGSRNGVTFDVSNANLSDGYYTIGTSDESASPLPVELVSFKGKAQATGNHLNWETASEVNSAYFSLQKAHDDVKRFKEITRIDAAGFSSHTQLYSHLDENIEKGTNYYRLKQVDLDGSQYYYDIIKIENEGELIKPQISIYPNPGSGEISVDLGKAGLSGSEIPYEVFDLKGQRLISGKTSDDKLDASNLENGVYLIRLNTVYGVYNLRYFKE